MKKILIILNLGLFLSCCSNVKPNVPSEGGFNKGEVNIKNIPDEEQQCSEAATLTKSKPKNVSALLEEEIENNYTSAQNEAEEALLNKCDELHAKLEALEDKLQPTAAEHTTYISYKEEVEDIKNNLKNPIKEKNLEEITKTIQKLEAEIDKLADKLSKNAKGGNDNNDRGIKDDIKDYINKNVDKVMKFLKLNSLF
jgi:DNA repair exonuclease SbcCD ATPase subunit